MPPKVNKLLILIVIIAASIQVLKAQSMNDVWKAIYNEQPEKAKEILKKLVKDNPTDAELTYRLGNIYYQLGKKDSAAFYFNLGMQLPNEKSNYNLAGQAKLALDAKDNDKALADFNALTNKDRSKDPKVYIFMGDAWFNSAAKNADQGITYLKKASELDPKNIEAYMTIAPMYLAKGDGGNAVSAYEHAIEKDPKLSVAYMKIGQIYMMSRNYEEAYKDFQLSNSLDTSFIPVYHELAEFNYYLKKFGEAARLQKIYLDKAGPTVERLSRYADYLFLNKDYPATISVIEGIVKQDSTNVILSRLIGYSYYEQGKYQDAANYLQKFFSKIAANKIISSDYAYYGKALAKIPGSDSLAIVYLNKAVTLDSTNADLYADLAVTLLAQNKFREAAAAYQKQMDVSKPSSVIYFKIGAAYLKASNYDTIADLKASDYIHADSAFGEYSKLQPESATGYLYRAKVNTYMDTTSENGLAKPYYEKFIELASADSASITKFKTYLIEAHKYLGYYYYLKNDMDKSKEEWMKVKALDPDDQQANDFFKALAEQKKAQLKAIKPKQ